MKKLPTILVIGLVLVGAGVVYITSVDTKKPSAIAKQTPKARTAGNSQAVTVKYTDTGFQQREITIQQGSTITFINQRTGRPMWVASNTHPEHLIYPEFDQARVLGYEPLPKDNTFAFTFTKRGAWGYHDHYDAAMEGTITVN